MASKAIAIVTAFVWACSVSAYADTPDAIRKIDRALVAIGGDLNTSNARFADANIGVEVWMLEQTGDLSGNWSRYTIHTDAHLDLVGRAGDLTVLTSWPILDQSGGSRNERFADWGAARAIQDNAWDNASAAARRDDERYLDLFPSALLLQAREAADARLDREGRVIFTRGAERVALIFQQDTGALSGFEIKAAYPDDTFLAPWGEVTIRGSYSFWYRDASGVSVPRQTSITLDGRPWRLYELSRVAMRSHTRADFTAPGLTAPAPALSPVLPVPFTAHRERVSPHVYAYRGAWGVGVLERAHDLVVFEAVISPAYTRAFEAQLARDFPGKPVAVAFTTSNAWPHAGGVGAYAAEGVPLYGLAANRDLVEAFISRAGGRRSTFHTVRDGFALASDIVVRASSGPELRNMMFLVLPSENLVWASDAMQLDENGDIAVHARQYVAEMLASVCADVRPETQFLAMHAGPVSAADLARQFTGEPNQPCPSLPAH